MDCFCDLIDNAPAVEEVSVIEFKEPLPMVKAQKIVKALSKEPKGEWILQYRNLNGEYYTCSQCERMILVDPEQSLSDYPYCHCGAYMRGGAENE